MNCLIKGCFSLKERRIMYYTNSIINHKLGSYTEDQTIAKKLGFKIKMEEIDLGYDGCAYEKGFAPVAPEKNYVELRLSAYPSVSEQLDMMYWDKVRGTSVWKDTITAIKDKFPKK